MWLLCQTVLLHSVRKSFLKSENNSEICGFHIFFIDFWHFEVVQSTTPIQFCLLYNFFPILAHYVVMAQFFLALYFLESYHCETMYLYT